MNRISILSRAQFAQTGEEYPVVAADPCLPWDAYEVLVATRPSYDSIVGDRDPGSNLRMDRHALSLLDDFKTSLEWKEFVLYHTSKVFFHEMLDMFEDQIDQMYPDLEPRLGKPLRDMDVRVRGTSRSHAVTLDVNVGVNTPVVGAASAVRGPHVDNPVELFAGLLYMRPSDELVDYGGHLVTYRPKVRRLIFHDKAELTFDQVQEVASFAYQTNNMVAFINGPKSIHGVTPRVVGAPARLLVNVIAELPIKLFPIPR